MRALIVMIGLLFVPSVAMAAQYHDKQTQQVDELQEPLYNPFVERYVMDELRQLRVDMNELDVTLTKEVVDRELAATQRAVTYATDTVTYFFYLIAGISSVLLLVGWNSIRDIKERVHHLADSKVNEMVALYEARLAKLEEDLNHKSKGIRHAQQNLAQHQDIHSLWLKAAQETILSNRLAIYDQILKLDPHNAEALTYKADTALEMNEPQWAINLCQQALAIEPENRHAFYQLAGAHALLHKPFEAVEYLRKALEGSEGYREQILEDAIFAELHENEAFQALLSGKDDKSL